MNTIQPTKIEAYHWTCPTCEAKNIDIIQDVVVCWECCDSFKVKEAEYDMKYELFEHMQEEHDIILIDSELDEIISIVTKGGN